MQNGLSGILTDGNEQCGVGNTSDRVLQLINNHRGQNRSSGTRLASDSKSFERTLQKARQVRRHPKTGHFLPVMGQMGTLLRDITQNTIFRAQP